VEINETISLLDPDICIPIPVISHLVDICFHFTQVNYTKTTVCLMWRGREKERVVVL
jgi:hypothetical protein